MNRLYGMNKGSGMDFDCSTSDKARQKADGGGRQAKACHLFGGASRVIPHLTNSCNNFLGKIWKDLQVNGNKDKGYNISIRKYP